MSRTARLSTLILVALLSGPIYLEQPAGMPGAPALPSHGLHLTISSDQHWFQVGAYGGEEAAKNRGSQVEIQTVVPQRIIDADKGAFNYFWVGAVLENGGFLQLGYAVEPGYYCLKGTIREAFQCTGASEQLTADEAEWEWQYWPDANKHVYYYEIGSKGSAGLDGSWHTYRIVSQGSGAWQFYMDSVFLGFVNPGVSLSHEFSANGSPSAVAENGQTRTDENQLGPVEFRNLSYYDGSSWRPVSHGFAYVGYAVNTSHTLSNPYGVNSARGIPSAFKAGSGIPQPRDGAVLWDLDLNAKKIVSLSVRPSIVSLGEPYILSGSVAPPGRYQVKLTWMLPDGSTRNEMLETDPEGAFQLRRQVTELDQYVGVWKVQAQIESARSSSVTFTVSRQSLTPQDYTTVVVLSSFIVASGIIIYAVFSWVGNHRRRVPSTTYGVYSHIKYCMNCGLRISKVDRFCPLRRSIQQ